MSFLTIRIKPTNKTNKIIGIINKKKTPQSQNFIKILGKQANNIINIDFANLSKELAKGVKISYVASQILLEHTQNEKTINHK
jgi:hypothetical protein